MTRRPFFARPVYLLCLVLGAYLFFLAVILIPPYFFFATNRSNSARLVYDVWAGTADTRLVVILVPCLFAGLGRNLSLHPRWNRGYASWLIGTPWTPRQNFPLGPIRLVWEDLLLVGPLGLLVWCQTVGSPLLPATAYLLGFSLAAVGSLRGLAAFWSAAAWALLWSVAALIAAPGWPLAVILVLVAVLAQFAASQSMADFPWDLPDPMRVQKQFPLREISWPMTAVGPGVSLLSVPMSVGVTAAALAGWLTFVLATVVARDSLNSYRTFVFDVPIICLWLGVGRALVYCGAYWPPISWLGRLFTGRFVIPRYDVVFLTPFAATLVTALLWTLLPADRMPAGVAPAAIVFASTAIVINGGPRLRTWKLTGHHRLANAVKQRHRGNTGG